MGGGKRVDQARGRTTRHSRLSVSPARSFRSRSPCLLYSSVRACACVCVCVCVMYTYVFIYVHAREDHGTYHSSGAMYWVFFVCVFLFVFLLLLLLGCFVLFCILRQGFPLV